MASPKTTSTSSPAAPASVAGSASDASAPDSKPKILLHPVAVVDSPLAKGASLGRVAVLLSLLAWRMDGLVRDPVSTLWVSLPVVAAVQVGYAAVCLPPAGSSAGKKSRPGEKKKNVEGGSNAVSVCISNLCQNLYIHI